MAFCIALSRSKTATIIGNIGLSPLLLAASGILHESNSLRKVGDDAKLEWAVVLALHILTAGTTAILAIGASALQSSSPLPSDLTKVKVGIALLTTGWIILVGWAVQPWFRRSNTLHVEASLTEGKILIGVVLASIFIGIRVLYTLVAFVSQKKSLNPVTGTLAVRVVLVLLPELAVSLILLAYGWIIRNAMSSKAIDREAASVRLNSK
ncbi:C6 zinc finger domain protein [Beauveria brongniartii RCEF 3172]|uniref:C6 zinc finger domain protein n=1 Tax=Beauveria brongniartii RCEF 3172 TaxID=1081107 RepID=A0A167JGE4_9HYPO|nr:C6 zinc finger domain protein [Beauveria brongniartii RCEF 3172]